MGIANWVRHNQVSWSCFLLFYVGSEDLLYRAHHNFLILVWTQKLNWFPDLLHKICMRSNKAQKPDYWEGWISFGCLCPSLYKRLHWPKKYPNKSPFSVIFSYFVRTCLLHWVGATKESLIGHKTGSFQPFLWATNDFLNRTDSVRQTSSNKMAKNANKSRHGQNWK